MMCSECGARSSVFMCETPADTRLAFHFGMSEKKAFAKLDTFIWLVSQSSEYSRQLIITRVEALCIDDADAAAVALVVVAAAAAIIEQHMPKTITVNLRIFHSFALAHGSRAAALQAIPTGCGGLARSHRSTDIVAQKNELNFPMFAILFFRFRFYFIHSFTALELYFNFFFALYLFGCVLIAYLPLLSAS